MVFLEYLTMWVWASHIVQAKYAASAVTWCQSKRHTTTLERGHCPFRDCLLLRLHPKVWYSFNDIPSWTEFMLFTSIHKGEEGIQNSRTKDLLINVICCFWLWGEPLWHYATPQQQEAPLCDWHWDYIKGKIWDMTDSELAGWDIEHSAANVGNVSLGFKGNVSGKVLSSILARYSHGWPG